MFEVGVLVVKFRNHAVNSHRIHIYSGCCMPQFQHATGCCKSHPWCLGCQVACYVLPGYLLNIAVSGSL